MKLKQQKYYVIVEITDPYVTDLDYSGMDPDNLVYPDRLSRLLDSGYYGVECKLRLEDPEIS